MFDEEKKVEEVQEEAATDESKLDEAAA